MEERALPLELRRVGDLEWRLIAARMSEQSLPGGNGLSSNTHFQAKN